LKEKNKYLRSFFFGNFLKEKNLKNKTTNSFKEIDSLNNISKKISKKKSHTIIDNIKKKLSNKLNYIIK